MKNNGHKLLVTLLSVSMSSFFVSAQKYDPPTMGWSSWNTYSVNISDSIICKQAVAIEELGLLKAGYQYINIDDGYFGGRDENGKLYTHPQRFPNGLKGVVDFLHERGFKAGIYSDGGRNTCGHYWNNDVLGKGVGMYGHDQQDADFFFKELGFDFIKVDFCGGDYKQNSEHLDLDDQERYTAINNAIKATGRTDVRMNVCRWDFPGTWVHDVASSWRISHDIRPNWESVKSIIHENIYLSAYAGEYRFNDMDMLEIGKGLTDIEEETHFGMWCIMSSPLLIGCDVTNIPERSLELLLNKELIAINQDYPAQQAKVVKNDKNVLLLVKDLKKKNGTTRVAAIYNPTEKAVTWNLDRADLLLSGNITIRDVVKQTNLQHMGANQNSCSLDVAPHGVRILVLKGKKRLQASRYEAEWAWLNQYQEIWNTGEQIRYTERPDASAGACVTFLGNNPDNWMEWRDIYCKKGGKYRLTIHYFSPEERGLTVKVNDTTYKLETLPATADKAGAHSLEIQLDKGNNVIRLSEEKGWAPEIDCIDLEPCEGK